MCPSYRLIVNMILVGVTAFLCAGCATEPAEQATEQPDDGQAMVQQTQEEDQSPAQQVTRDDAMIPFTQQILEEHGLTPDDVLQLQFYVSQKITLQREATSAEAGVNQGRLIRKSTKVLDEFIIEPGTPGIAIDAGPHWVMISFEEGTTLRFEPLEARDGVKVERYALAAREWKDRVGTIAFDGGTYAAIRRSDVAALSIDQTSLNHVIENKWTLQGRRLE